MIKKCLNSFFVASILIISSFVQAFSQDLYSRISSDKNIASGIYHPYVHGDLSDTPAPKGFKPFYISHFGRHGSRYHQAVSYFDKALETLENASSEKLLTETGISLCADIRKLYDEHIGQEGELSPLGGREHKAIAKRMYARFPSVFNDPSRKEVECVSSNVRRCITSMANFSQSLSSCNGTLDIRFFTGDRYFKYIMKQNPQSKMISGIANPYVDSLRYAICSADKLLSKVFVSQDAANKFVKDPVKFARAVYMAGCICGCLDFLNLDIYKYFDIDELAPQFYAYSTRMYTTFGPSGKLGKAAMLSADDLLRDFITRADNALSGESDRAADFRFGHDTGIVPLMVLLGLEGFADNGDFDHCWERWNTYDRIPMGSNFQMIFYKSKKTDEVLVKMLYNEQERLIDGLNPEFGPYYDWLVLREHLCSRLDSCGK